MQQYYVTVNVKEEDSYLVASRYRLVGSLVLHQKPLLATFEKDEVSTSNVVVHDEYGTFPCPKYTRQFLGR